MFLLKEISESEDLVYTTDNNIKFFFKLLSVSSELLVSLDNFLQEYGLRHGKWLTLYILMRSTRTSLTPSELADMQGVTRATITSLVTSLEKNGLINRMASLKDRRGVDIEITEKGKAFMEEISPKFHQIILGIIGDISDENKEIFLLVLEKLERQKSLFIG